jgi:hypothetical protein
VRRFFLFVLLLISIVKLPAQDVLVKGVFKQDTLKIGEPTPYILSARYPASLTLIFPEDNFDFGIFELEDKQYFPTKTIGGISLDSAVYYLSTFEIDTVLYYNLPVFVLRQNDSSTIYPPYDSIFVKQMVAFVPDSVSADALPLLTNTTYYRVKNWINTPLFIAIFIAFILMLVLTWFFFGKRIIIYFKLRKLKKQYQTFISNYDSAVFIAGQEKNIATIQTAISIWKKYMEQISDLPFTKLTSKEIIQLDKFKHLQPTLRELDLALYAQQSLKDLNAFMQLKNLAIDLYEEKIKDTSLGKR